MTIKKLKSIDIINVLSDLVSKKLETTVKLPASTIANIAGAYQLDADMKEKIAAICYMHDAKISNNEIIMMIDDDELYTKLNEYGKMLLEIENLFTHGSAYSQ